MLKINFNFMAIFGFAETECCQPSPRKRGLSPQRGDKGFCPLSLSSSRRIRQVREKQETTVAKRRPSSLCLHISPQVVKEQLTTIHPMHAHKRKCNTTASVLQECSASSASRKRDLALVKPGRSCYIVHGTRIGCTEVSSHAL